MSPADKESTPETPPTGESELEAVEQEVRLSNQEFQLLIEVFSTLRRWSLDLKRAKGEDAQGDNSRTRS